MAMAMVSLVNGLWTHFVMAMATERDTHMSHFSYACKTEQQNGISHLISELLRTLNVTEWTFLNSLIIQTC